MDEKAGPKLKIYYQPIVQPTFSEIIGFSSLVRLSEKGLGNIPQDVFFPIADKSGMGMLLGKWAFAEVCATIRKIDDKQKEVEYISTRLLADELRKKSLMHTLLEIIKETDVPSEKICLEIQEDFLNVNSDLVIERIFELKKEGFKVALDNYSATYISLSRLDSVPVDIIKLSESLTNKLEADEKAAELVESITKQAKAIEMDVIASGVEKEEQKLLLMELGCSKMQGLLFGKPMSAREILGLK